jgi:hypothetical protein
MKDMNKPATIPPIVSIEKDLPGSALFTFLEKEISLMKVKPETRQKGRSIRKVIIMLSITDGVTPVLRKILLRRISNAIDNSGLRANARLILRISFIDDFPPAADPIEDAISHDPRNIPATSSYPPETFIISLIRISWMAVLLNPAMNRFIFRTDGSSGIKLFSCNG